MSVIFTDAAAAVPVIFAAEDILTEAETRSEKIENAPWSRDVWCHGLVIDPVQLSVGAATAVGSYSSRRLTMVLNNSTEDKSSFVL